MSSLMMTIERAGRGACFICHFGLVSTAIFLEALIRPLLCMIDSVSDNYFSKNYKLRNAGEYLGKQWCFGMLDCFGITLVTEFKGEIPKSYKDNCILMFTHGSNLDPPILEATWPYFANFVAKKSLFKVPVFGALMKVCGMIPIDRENLTSAIDTLKVTGETVTREKKTFCIAAEGTRRRSNSIGPEHLLPLKKGPFHLAKACNIDIVPVAIIGANRLFPPGHVLPRPGTLVVRYLEKIPKEVVEKASIADLQAEVEKKLKEGLEAVPDQVIYNAENRPKGYFLFLLCFLYVFWSLILRFVM